MRVRLKPPGMEILIILFNTVCFFAAVINGQSVRVTMQSEASYNGGNTTLSCSEDILDSSYKVVTLAWFKGEITSDSSTWIKIAELFRGNTSPAYSTSYDDQSRYIASRDSAKSISTFDIFNVEFSRDRGQYLCRVTVIQSDGMNPHDAVASTDLIVYTLPTSIDLSDSTGNYPSNGEVSYLVEGEGRLYTCQVPGINPEATISWTVGSQPLTPDGNENDGDADELITSRSMATLTATWSNHGEMLTCQATNKDDNPGISISVMLDVKVPPKSSAMSLLDSSGPLQDTTDVDEGTAQTFTCRVQGTRPAATIKWYLDDVEQTTTTPAPGGDIGLVDTEGHWTFTPERVNHKQIVTCEANTAESKPPFPSVSTTLNVIGPPDTPVISGSLTMTEYVATTLTCTADLGYPYDWYLVWSNEGTAIEYPTGTTAVLSGTSQRYMFTGQLEFTPKRQDNTHIIKCSASRPSWTSTPIPEQTLGPINVQYETNITNKHLTDIKSGLTANLSCTAKGNPAPVITWFGMNKTEIIHGGNNNKYMVEVSHTTSDTDMTSGDVTTSKLSIRAVDAQVDYGVYTCNSINGIGLQDSHEINLNGTRRPNNPIGFVRTDRTSSSIAVRWTAGYDGGEPQWFHVRYKKTADSSETVSDKIDGGVTAYNVDGLESYTEYEIRVYAENELGRNPSPGSIVEYTLPGVPRFVSGITIEYNTGKDTVNIGGLRGNGECIQLEVKYEGSSDWSKCVDCIAANGEVTLSEQCPKTRKRKGRDGLGDTEVLARFCQMSGRICSDSIDVHDETKTDPALQPSVSYLVFIGVVGSIALLAVTCIVVLVTLLRRQQQRRSNEQRMSLSAASFQKERNANKLYHYQNATEMDLLPTQPSSQELGRTVHVNLPSTQIEFPRDQLCIVKELGSGAFGQVLLGEAKETIVSMSSKVTLVAVKTLKESVDATEKRSMIRELNLMKKLPEHKNIVKFLGFCIEKDPPYILIEYLPRGNLKDLMKDSRSKGGRVYGNLHGVSKSLTSGDLMKFARDVADGMNFISSQKCIHRDLAARNVLVAEDMTCKVSDFGLARDVIDGRAYERQSEGRLPLRWMALESIVDDVYTTQSDVWSFGVLLWEIITLGARPYPDMSAKMMVKELRDGYRMPKPNHCRKELYHIMLKCWEEYPESRPMFLSISDELKRLIRDEKECISIAGYEETVYEITIPDDLGEKV